MLCLQTKRFSNRLKEMWDNTQFKGIFTKLDYQFELYKRLRCAQVMFAIGVEDPIRTVLCTSGRAQGTHAFLGVIIRPLPIHSQISGRASQLLNWFQLMGVLNPYFGPPLKFSCELLLIQIMLHKTVQTTHHLKLLLFAFHHCKDFLRGCQVEVPRFDRSLLLETLALIWTLPKFFLCNPNSPLSASLERQ